MTAPAPAAAVPVLLDRAVAAADVFVLAPEIIGMAARTIRSVLRVRVGNVLIVAAVTGAAAEVAGMVARIATHNGMSEIDGRPARWRVADLAFRAGDEVRIQPLRFAARRR